MSLAIFKLILWIPFLLVFFGIGITFSLKGFKKGIFHALVSTGATVAATFVSYFVAKFVASFAVGGVLSLLPDFSKGADSIVASVIPMIMEGIVTGLLALTIFSVLLAILVPVGKLLFALIPTPKPKSLIQRILGLALRFAEGVVFTILVLLPIYGTLGTYAPAVEMAFDLSAQTTQESTTGAPTARDYASCALEHPVVALAKTAPFTAIYNGLSGNSTINVPEAIQTITDMTSTFQAIKNGDFANIDWRIFANMQKNLVNADWFYSLFNSVAGSLEASLAEMGGNDPAYLKAIQALNALPKESFTQCSSGLLDWMSFASEKGLFKAIENGTVTQDWVDQSGIMEKAAEIQKDLPSDFPFMDLVNQLVSKPAA